MKGTRTSIPHVLRKINESVGDFEQISYYENVMVSIYTVSLLIVAALASFVVRFFLQKMSFPESFGDGFILIFLAILFALVVKLRINVNKMNWIIAVLSGITLIYFYVRFYNVIGPAVWTVAFIQLSLALIRVTKTMLMVLELATLITFIHSIYNTVYNQYNSLDTIYYVVQLSLFLILCVIFAVVHQINTRRYFWVEKQLQTMQEKNSEIMSLNEEIKKSQQKVTDIAYHDLLTGLPNRYYLTNKLNDIIVQCQCKDRFLGVFFIDLDDFKRINDTLGHNIGDELLKLVALRLVNKLRPDDLVARFGGDEFIILIQSADEHQEMKHISEKILDCFQPPFNLDGENCYISASLGLAVCPTDGVNGEILIKHADMAMYKAKEMGKNQYVRFSENLLERY